MSNRNQRRPAAVATFAALEPRRLMAVDLTGSTGFAGGLYGANDTIEVPVSLKASSGGGSQTGYPVAVTVYLSKDKSLGNADDVAFTSTVFLLDKSAKTQTQKLSGHTGSSPSAGSYYVAVVADEYKTVSESNEKNNVSWSSGKSVTIVTDALKGSSVVGTSKSDKIVVRQTWSNLIVTVNGKSVVADQDALSQLKIDCGAGNDSLKIEGNVSTSLLVYGGAGNDTLYGGASDDRIDGGSGNDKLLGGGGYDYLYGSSGNDTLVGEAGNDSIVGGSGKDKGPKDPLDTFSSVESIY